MVDFHGHHCTFIQFRYLKRYHLCYKTNILKIRWLKVISNGGWGSCNEESQWILQVLFSSPAKEVTFVPSSKVSIPNGFRIPGECPICLWTIGLFSSTAQLKVFVKSKKLFTQERAEAHIFLATQSSSRSLIVGWSVGWSVGWLVCQTPLSKVTFRVSNGN